MKTINWCQLILILALCFWVTSVFAFDKIVKYPPMTAREVQTVIGEAAEWFAKMISEGKEQEALAILSQPPQFKLSEDAWRRLKKVLNPEVLQTILPLKGIEFEEGKNLIPILQEKKIPNLWIVVKLVLQHADEVFSNRWNKGSVMDYRFVVSFNCKKNLHVTHALVPQATQIKINAIKSINGKYYIWEECNKLLSGEVDSWWTHAPAVNPFNLPENMYIFMRQVKDSDYQVGTVVRHITKSENELNKNFR